MGRRRRRLRLGPGPVRRRGPADERPGYQDAVLRGTRAAGLRAAGRRVPGRLVCAEPRHGHLRLAGLARGGRPGDGGSPEARAAGGWALAWWAAAIPVRSAYVPLEFGRRRLWLATADSALLAAVMAGYTLRARRVDPAAAALAVPEVAWTMFATVLSAAVARRNS